MNIDKAVVREMIRNVEEIKAELEKGNPVEAYCRFTNLSARFDAYRPAVLRKLARLDGENSIQVKASELFDAGPPGAND